MTGPPPGVTRADLEEYVLLALFALDAHAETAAEIVERARQLNRVDSAIEELRMTVVHKGGSERVKELLLKSRREGEVAKTYMEVTSPSVEAGFKLLLIDHPDKSDETLAYTPFNKRTTMISGAAKKGSFVGSDLSYEDLEIRDNVSGTHTLIEDGAEAWLIETTLADDSSYAKVRSTIAKSDLVIRKIEFFDDAGPVKVIEVLRTEKDGAVTIPVETRVTTLARGSYTKLEITSHQLNIGKDVLPDDTFEKYNLER